MTALHADVSFALCDVEESGCPIRYASQGFVNLFGYKAYECIGRSIGPFVGCYSIVRNGERDLVALSKDAGLPLSVLAEGMKLVMGRVRDFSVQAKKDLTHGHVLQLNRTQDGKVVVCDMSIQMRTHSTCGWPYHLVVHRPVLHITPAELLLATGAAYATMLQAQHLPMKQCLAAFDAEGGHRTLDHFVGSVWPSSMLQKWVLSEKSTRSSSNRSVGCSTHRRGSGSSAASDGSASSAGTWNSSYSEVDEDICMNPPSTVAAEETFRTWGTRKENVEEHESYAGDSDDDLDAHGTLSDSMEWGSGGDVVPFRPLAWASLFDQEVFHNFDFAFMVADPSLPGVPIGAGSDMFLQLTSYSKEALVGLSFESLYGSVPPNKLEGWEQARFSELCADAKCNTFSPADMSVFCARQHGEGELIGKFVGARSDGAMFRCLALLRQVMLDDVMRVVGVFVEIPSKGEHDYNDEDLGVPAVLYSDVLRNAFVAEQALASRFWCTFPFRRHFCVV